MHVVVAGGGTAGHVEPALALADALRRLDPSVTISALGTRLGLEARLVPARGYDLAEITRVPLPRRLTPELLRVPFRLRQAIRQTQDHLDRVNADVVVGFGGYVALPAYLAARRRRTPSVVHEANARAGLANRIGARRAAVVAAAVQGCGLPGAQVLGIPLRRQVATLDRTGSRAQARALFGLVPQTPVLLVTGGSQGAQRLNHALMGAARDLIAGGVQVLHVTGPQHLDEVSAVTAEIPGYHVVAYADQMELAYAAADLVVCRAGALTCAELTAVGLPAVFVPLPIGNGEQALNAGPVVAAGGGLLVPDAELTPEVVRTRVLPLLLDSDRLSAMGVAAASLGHRDADLALARLVLEAAS